MSVSTRYRIRDNCDWQRRARIARKQARKFPALGATVSAVRALHRRWHEEDAADFTYGECSDIVWQHRNAAERQVLAQHGLSPATYDMAVQLRTTHRFAYHHDLYTQVS